MPDADNENHEVALLNLVDDAVVAHTNAPEIVEAGRIISVPERSGIAMNIPQDNPCK